MMLCIISRRERIKGIWLKRLSMNADKEGRAETFVFEISQAIHAGVIKHARDAAAIP